MVLVDGDPHPFRGRRHVDVVDLVFAPEPVDDGVTTAGQDPIAPASPAPFTPSGLVLQGTLAVSNTKSGPSAARGSA